MRRFVFPMSGLFLIWYFAYVLLGAFAHDPEINAEFEVRALTGVGAEKAVTPH